MWLAGGVRRARICQRCSALAQSEGSLRQEVAVQGANFIGACGSAHVLLQKYALPTPEGAALHFSRHRGVEWS
jgi:hypothetical protein